MIDNELFVAQYNGIETPIPFLPHTKEQEVRQIIIQIIRYIYLSFLRWNNNFIQYPGYIILVKTFIFYSIVNF